MTGIEIVARKYNLFPKDWKEWKDGILASTLGLEVGDFPTYADVDLGAETRRFWRGNSIKSDSGEFCGFEYGNPDTGKILYIWND